MMVRRICCVGMLVFTCMLVLTGSLRAQALHEAIKNGTVPEVRALVEQGADVNEVDQEGFTPLLLAARRGSVPITRMLIEAGAIVNPPEGTFSPLHMAAWQGNRNVVQLLLRNGADPNALDGWQIAPLNYATWRNNGEAVGLLLNHGADPGVRELPDGLIGRDDTNR